MKPKPTTPNENIQTTNSGAGVSAGASPEGAPVSKVAGKPVKPEPSANLELVGIIEKYDDNAERASQSFIEWVEFVQVNDLDRATVVCSMMKARSITFETAQSQYSRLKKLLNDQEVLKELKEGKISMKAAREKTTTPQKNPASAKPEAKEARYTNTLKAFIAAAKESGLARRDILLGVEAELKAAEIK